MKRRLLQEKNLSSTEKLMKNPKIVIIVIFEDFDQTTDLGLRAVPGQNNLFGGLTSSYDGQTNRTKKIEKFAFGGANFTELFSPGILSFICGKITTKLNSCTHLYYGI
ncbi:hypothetical protein PV325_010941, partial [Microctonus aethiopoides]